jgi:hypothetical protein
MQRLRTFAIGSVLGGAGAARAGAPEVVHAPPVAVPAGEPLVLAAALDAEAVETDVVVRYRPPGAADYARAPFLRAVGGGWEAVIPADHVRAPAVEYYIAVGRGDGAPVFASPAAPHRVAVELQGAERWQEAHRLRLGGRRNEMKLFVQYLDYGNRFDYADRYTRGEVAWSYRLLEGLYAVHVGYGFMDGRTPEGEVAGGRSVRRAAHYGSGGVTLRAHEHIYVDGRASIGYSLDGFIVGGMGTVTLGRPWQSCVNISLEGYQDMRSEFVLRLQWDTVWPWIMGAAVHISDLPGAPVDGGSFLAFDASHPLGDALRVGGKLLVGSRDGPGRGGAALTLAADF